jgi:outer membrane protein assembly factor BamB
MIHQILRRFVGIEFILVALAAGMAHAEEQWPEFRGPRGDGRAEGSQPPVEFGESKNLAWKVPIHGKGWSSPVVWGPQIWLTTATEDGTQMFALCVDRATGKVVHDRLVFKNANPQTCDPTNSYASPTPAIEQGRVYLHFGSYGTICLDTRTGERIWERRDLPCDHWRGPGSSPILFENCLYVAYDGYDQQYVVALDKATGSTVWRRDREIDYGSDDGDVKKAYCTCQIIVHDGVAQLISPSAAETIAYNPRTGEEFWRLRHGGMNTATRPVFANGLVYVTVGDAVADARPALLAVRPGKNPAEPAQLVWSMGKSPPKRPSPLVVDDLLFTINDEGVACCLEAVTGRPIWQQRVAGTYRASPIYAAGRIYFLNLDGDITVIEAGRQFKKLAENRLEHGCQASPAVVGDALLVRSTHNLYCFEAP